MAHLLRGKQAGVQNDLSTGISAEFFGLDKIACYGINSQISTLAYDPVQSLLAVGVNDSAYGNGQVYIFGQKRVCATLYLPRKASVKSLFFCADKLVAIDSRNEIIVFSLETKKPIASYAAPGFVTSVASDPCLDWLFLGLQTGDTVIYDLDRHVLAPLKLPNYWRERSPKARVLSVVALALHPRDVGKLLIGYTEGAVIYSFKQNKTVQSFQYELPPGAPGGSPDPNSSSGLRHPRLTHAAWHPTGTFVLTGHEDSSLVIWDVKDGRAIMARTFQDINVNKPSAAMVTAFSPSRPIIKIAWCSKQNPEDTGILIAGGASAEMPGNGLSFLDFGLTPNYATSSWQQLADHFASPKRQQILPTPPHADVVDFCMIPQYSPHYGGAHDPIAIIALLSSGEILTLGFPSGRPISPINQLHLSLSFVHPFVNRYEITALERSRWISMKERRQSGPSLLRGGAEATHPLKRYESRTIIQTSHTDGTVRLWDVGHGDEIENGDMVQADIRLAVGHVEGTLVTACSVSGNTGELAVGTKAGEVIVYRWGRNRSVGQRPGTAGNDVAGFVDISDRVDPSLQEGLLPWTLFNPQEGPVTALRMSDIGFLGVGFGSGKLVIIDLRGPAVIFDDSVSNVTKLSKRHSLRRGNTEPQTKQDWLTVVEFGIMTLEEDSYSSILCFCGTHLGHVATFQLIPESNGTYKVQHSGYTSLQDQILMISPIDADTGGGASATQATAAKLGTGYTVNGVLVATTPSGARIFRPPAAKGAHKAWDDVICRSTAIVEYASHSHALVGVFGDGTVRLYSLPALREIASTKMTDGPDVSRLSEARITRSGEVIVWTGPSELAVFSVRGTGQNRSETRDSLFNPEASVSPRPTISNLQWIAGAQYITPADLDLLIGGPDRPMSRRMIEQARAEDLQRGMRDRQAGAGSSSAAGSEAEGYMAYMQRQLNERTQKLNIVGDSMDHLQEQSAGWAKDVGKFVNQQKKKAVLGVLGSKLGL